MTKMNTDKGVFRILAGAAVFGRRYVSEQKWPTWVSSLSKRSMAQRVTSTGAGDQPATRGWPPAALASHRRSKERGRRGKQGTGCLAQPSLWYSSPCSSVPAVLHCLLTLYRRSSGRATTRGTSSKRTDQHGGPRQAVVLTSLFLPRLVDMARWWPSLVGPGRKCTRYLF